MPQPFPLIAIDSEEQPRHPRQVFVAYPYGLHPAKDYRRVFNELTDTTGIRFVFADEEVTALHLLQKVVTYIRASQFGIYDISGWNANVTLELGLALGLREKIYLAIDSSMSTGGELPADLRGIDRIQYRSYQELQEKIAKILAKEIPSDAKLDYDRWAGWKLSDFTIEAGQELSGGYHLNQLEVILERLAALEAWGIIVDIALGRHQETAQMLLIPDGVLLTNNVAADASYLDRWNAAARSLQLDRFPIKESSNNWYLSLRGDWQSVTRKLTRVLMNVFEVSEHDRVYVSVFT